MLGSSYHRLVDASGQAKTHIHIDPHNITDSGKAVSAGAYENDHLEPIGVDGADSLCAPIPNPGRVEHGRIPLQVHPTGFATVKFADQQSAKYSEVNADTEQLKPRQRFQLTDEEFNKLSETIKKKDGKLLAMTAYGAVAVPDEVLEGIPEKFEKDPLYVDKTHFVAKPQNLVRNASQKTVQHRHHFVDVPKSVCLNKFVSNGKERVIEVPKPVYVPIKRQNKIECPLGFRYTETPLDVTMKKPAKVVPVSEKLLVKRVIRYSKPVIKQKIVEVPKIVYKDVPTPIVKKIDYYVPKYVEKIVEVKFGPGMELPAESGQIYDKIPDETEIKKYIDTLNEQARKGIDEYIVWTEDGAQLLLAPDKKTVLKPDGSVARDANNNPIVLGDSSSPNMEEPADDVYVVDDKIVVNKLNEETEITVGSNVTEIVLPVDATYDVEVVEVDADDVAAVEQVALKRASYHKVAAVKPLNYVPKSLVPNLKVAPNMASAIVENEHGIYAQNLDGIKQARAERTAQLIHEHSDSIYPVALEPVVRVDKPSMRSTEVRIHDDRKVLTTLGEMSPECLGKLSCGKPARLVNGPYFQSLSSVPIGASRKPDAQAIQQIQEALSERMNDPSH